MRPARYTLEIPQRGTLRLRLRLPITFAGQRFIAAVYDERRTQRLLPIQVLFPEDAAPVEGTTLIELYAPRSATRAMTQDGIWDLLVLDAELPDLPADAPEDDGTYYLRGPAVLVPGTSDEEDEILEEL